MGVGVRADAPDVLRVGVTVLLQAPSYGFNLYVLEKAAPFLGKSALFARLLYVNVTELAVRTR